MDTMEKFLNRISMRSWRLFQRETLGVRIMVFNATISNHTHDDLLFQREHYIQGKMKSADHKHAMISI